MAHSRRTKSVDDLPGVGTGTTGTRDAPVGAGLTTRSAPESRETEARGAAVGQVRPTCRGIDGLVAAKQTRPAPGVRGEQEVVSSVDPIASSGYVSRGVRSDVTQGVTEWCDTLKHRSEWELPGHPLMMDAMVVARLGAGDTVMLPLHPSTQPGDLFEVSYVPEELGRDCLCGAECYTADHIAGICGGLSVFKMEHEKSEEDGVRETGATGEQPAGDETAERNIAETSSWVDGRLSTLPTPASVTTMVSVRGALTLKVPVGRGPRRWKRDLTKALCVTRERGGQIQVSDWASSSGYSEMLIVWCVHMVRGVATLGRHTCSFPVATEGRVVVAGPVKLESCRGVTFASGQNVFLDPRSGRFPWLTADPGATTGHVDWRGVAQPWEEVPEWAKGCEAAGPERLGIDWLRGRYMHVVR